MVCVNPGRSDYAAVTNDPQISVALKKMKTYFSLILCILEGSAAALLHDICILGPRLTEQLHTGTLPVVLAERKGRSFCLKVTISSVHISLVKASRMAILEVMEGGECSPWGGTVCCHPTQAPVFFSHWVNGKS